MNIEVTANEVLARAQKLDPKLIEIALLQVQNEKLVDQLEEEDTD